MKISILGCGWLGLPLAKELQKQGHRIKGSTTSAEKLGILSSEGIQPYQISVSSEGISGEIQEFLAETNVLIIDIPPGLRRDPEQDFAGGIEKIVKEVEKSGLKKLLFVSSTTVYEDTAEIPTYTEEDAPNGTSEAAKQLISVEKMLLQNVFFDACILRFGGLIGADRHPVKYLSGRKNISNPLAPVNLIHQQDCINIISAILKKDAFNGIYNGVFPEHPTKKEYYSKAAIERNLPVPEFDFDAPSQGKIIDASKVERELGVKFQNKI
ncbi:epimerase [Salinimicrobium marinum]|uniref:Epimerase n=1 Tax=Salinimicrobium marinum TaxID=680283 RepID=A0A918VRU2_9FLAO|nr:NAD(P)H-binding protein [Salinimicrobium marinum]GHA23392.1 epimerase [Salinimicrobium marinum]